MNPSPLDDRLHLLAEQVAAPPSPAAREAIARRAGVLRRRRRIRNAAAGGLLAVAAVAGVVAVTVHRPDDVDIRPADPTDAGAAPPPALKVELAGWEIVGAEDIAVPADVTPDDEPGRDGALQVFRRPGDLAGPTVLVRHRPAGDAVVAEPGDRTVGIGDAEGHLRRTGEQSVTVRWSPDHGDTDATVQAWGLAEDQVVVFVRGLRSRDDDIASPPSEDDDFGFVASELPAGIEESPVVPVNARRPGLRRLELEAGARTAEVVIDEGGEPAFEAELADRLATAGDVEAMSVLHRPAVAIEHPDDGRWSLIWRHTDQAVVVATLSGVDRATVTDFAAGVREVSDHEWRDILADHR